MLAEVAGSLIACVRAELSMRALESAYLNGVSHEKKMSYRFSLSRDQTRTKLSVAYEMRFFNDDYVEANRKKRFCLDAQNISNKQFFATKVKRLS